MPYTLWSHGRLLGESDLHQPGSPRFDIPEMRGMLIGDFHPTAAGLELMPIAVGPSQTLYDLRHAGELERDHREVLRALSAACAERDSLQLEVRDPDGKVVRSDYVELKSGELLEKWAHVDELPWDDEPPDFLPPSDEDAELEEMIQHDLAVMDEWDAEREAEQDGWQPDDETPDWEGGSLANFYQLQVMLEGYERRFE